MADASRRQILSKAVFALPLGAAALASVDTRPLSAQPRTTQSLTTLVNSFVPGVGGFVGTLTMTGVNVVNGVLMATANLTGNVLGPTGAVLGSVDQPVAAPVSVAASCSILSLTLGPLHLDLLGLVVDLNQVVLNITAVPGAGNLLGNLLCAVAGLLDGGGALSNLLQNVANLLNQILAAL
jgi:hypothetical protein